MGYLVLLTCIHLVSFDISSILSCDLFTGDVAECVAAMVLRIALGVIANAKRFFSASVTPLLPVLGTRVSLISAEGGGSRLAALTGEILAPVEGLATVAGVVEAARSLLAGNGTE